MRTAGLTEALAHMEGHRPHMLAQWDTQKENEAMKTLLGFVLTRKNTLLS